MVSPVKLSKVDNSWMVGWWVGFGGDSRFWGFGGLGWAGRDGERGTGDGGTGEMGRGMGERGMQWQWLP